MKCLLLYVHYICCICGKQTGFNLIVKNLLIKLIRKVLLMHEHKNTTWNFFIIILYTKSVSLSPSLLTSLSLSATALIPIFINEENIFMNFDKQLQVCSFNWSSLKEYWIFLLVVDIIFLFFGLVGVLKDCETARKSPPFCRLHFEVHFWNGTINKQSSLLQWLGEK